MEEAVGVEPGESFLVLTPAFYMTVTFRWYEATDWWTHADDARTPTHDASSSTYDDASQAGHDATRPIRTNRYCFSLIAIKTVSSRHLHKHLDLSFFPPLENCNIYYFSISDHFNFFPILKKIFFFVDLLLL